MLFYLRGNLYQHGGKEIIANTESFSIRHAGRSTINVNDVMLLARRNEGLESILRAFVDQQKEVAQQQQHPQAEDSD